MAVLLAGGAGYIGLHTIVSIVESGMEAIVADNFINSKPFMLRRAEEIIGRKIPLYECDVRNAAALDEIFTQNDIQAVIHFAAHKSPPESVVNPLKYYRNNIDSTLALLEAMNRHSVKRIVFSSSATVYGMPEEVPLTEEMKTSAINPYGWTKIISERIISDWAAATKGASAILLRYFNPVGAHESGAIGEFPTGVPVNLMPNITQTLSDKFPDIKVLNITGNDYPTPDGTCIRDYIHIMDLAGGHLSALEYSLNHEGVEIINLGTGKGISVMEMINMFEKTNNITIPKSVAPRRLGDAPVSFADAAKAEKLLNWRAVRSLEDMCRDAWRWQQELDTMM